MLLQLLLPLLRPLFPVVSELFVPLVRYLPGMVPFFFEVLFTRFLSPLHTDGFPERFMP